MADFTEAEAVAAMIDARSVHKVAGTENLLLASPSLREVDIEKYLDAPIRPRASHQFRDTASLADFWNRFSGPKSQVFSDRKANKIRVVIDDHDPAGAAAHREHTATFVAEFSQQYAAWRKMHRVATRQKPAGEFLEDRMIDVVQPDPATLMDTIMTFDALKSVQFKESTRLRDGYRQFIYVEEDQARGDVRLPEEITLLVPVFFRQEPERITVRIRYAIEEGKLTFTFVIANIEELEQQAFERCEQSFLIEAKPGGDDTIPFYNAIL